MFLNNNQEINEFQNVMIMSYGFLFVLYTGDKKGCQSVMYIDISIYFYITVLMPGSLGYAPGDSTFFVQLQGDIRRHADSRLVAASGFEEGGERDHRHSTRRADADGSRRSSS